MRDFFIGALDKLVAVFAVLMAIGVIIAAFSAASEGGILPFLGILIGGAIYTIVFVGFIYLGLGVYYNTKRTAELLAARNG